MAVSATRRIVISKWLIAAIPALAAIVMLGVLVVSYHQTMQLTGLSLRGEADALLDGVSRTRREGVGPLEDRLRQAMAENAGRGLQFVALLQQSGPIIAASGPVPADFAEASKLLPGESKRIGRSGWMKSRHLLAPPPGRMVQPPPQGMPREVLVFEFEPRRTDELVRTANRTLWTGIAAIVGLLVLSAVARVLLLRRDEAIRSLEGERHLAAVGQMSAVLAHEIRNPLAAMKGHAQLLVERFAAGTRDHEHAGRIVEASLRLEHLSKNLLVMVRDGAPEDPALERATHSPIDLARDVAGELGKERVEVRDAEAPARWSFDRLQLRQVLTNLVENALHASPGNVELSVLVDDQRRLVFEVRDHGPGVDPADVKRLFEPFFTRKARGTGLGLAIAKKIVEAHGGTIHVSNHALGGAVFRIELPSAA